LRYTLPLAVPASSADPFDASWRERLLVLGGMAAALAVAITLGMIFSPGATVELFVAVPTSFFAVGKFLPLWGISGKSQFGPYELGLVIWVMDTFNVVLFVYALEAFYRFPRLKRSLDKVQGHATLVLGAYPRLRSWTRVGVVLFVLFPVAGTGAVGATFIGILLRVPRQVLIACVSFGGLIGGMLMAFAAVHFRGAVESFQVFQTNPNVKYAFIAGVVVLLALGVWWMNRAYNRVIDQARRQAPPGD
jgi:uncharacterized membrane protein